MQRQSTNEWLADLIPGRGLSPALGRVFEALVTNPKLASYGDLEVIADAAAVNKSTVVRCAQALGFAGWAALQRELRARYLAAMTSEETFTAHTEGSVSGPGHSAFLQDIQNLKDAMESVAAEDVEAVIEAIANASRTVVGATGTLTVPGQVLAHLATSIGYPITLENRGAVHLASALANFGEHDLLIVFNVWRPIRDLLNSARIAKDAGARVVAITDSARGPYRDLADHLLVVPSEGVSFFQSITAATSLAYGLVDGLARLDPAKTRARLAAARRMWETLDTYE